jgi:hypothetical protein
VVQQTEAMINVSDKKAHVEARNNIIKTWQEFFKKAQVTDRNKPLTAVELLNPNHPVVIVINWCYTSEGFLFKVLNQSCRVKDFSKVLTMGAYCYALSIIIG